MELSRGALGRAIGLALIIAAAGCDRAAVQHVGTAKLSVQPPSIDFGLVWVGDPQSAPVTVHNDGQVEGHGSAVVTGNFSVDTRDFDVPAGGNTTLTVTYAPAREGHDVGRLDLGTLHVDLSGDARVIPDCPAATCRDTHFDMLSRACVTAFSADGTACHTQCTSGSCQSGACLGTFDTCDDGNACTAELCSEATGCSHSPVQCPAPSDPCQIATCDSKTGCGAVNAIDGTSCAADACYALSVHVCISGACVERPRSSGRCGDLWVSPFGFSRATPSMAYDAHRQRVVVFGGFHGGDLADTWEWDGAGWTQMHPAASPPPSDSTPMIFDTARQQVLLFSGQDLWAYDGTTWVQQTPMHRPPSRGDPSFAFDSDRQVAVLYGGVINYNPWTFTDDTWEWDGTDWVQKFPMASPPAREGSPMVYDAARKKMVIYGGRVNNTEFDGTWEYDGTSWTELSPAVNPGNSGYHSLAYDPVRQKTVMYGASISGVWEWDGLAWTLVGSAHSPTQGYWGNLVYDDALQRTVLYGGIVNDYLMNEVWEWDGVDWTRGDPYAIPLPRNRPGLAYDAHRQLTVMFGGGVRDWLFAPAETWEWDGAAWKLNPVTSAPPRRSKVSMAFDSSRNVVVMFGGEDDTTADPIAETWEFDGASWTQRFPAHSPPPRYLAAIAYDSGRKKTVLFGGTNSQLAQFYDVDKMLADTWEWDGTDWTETTPSSGPTMREGAAMAYDEIHAQTVLFGGDRDSDSIDDVNDTWVYDGTHWSQLRPTVSPTARDNHMMAYDPTRQRVMMFGGWDFSGNGSSNELWEWDGVDWSQRMPSNPPPFTGGAAMAYDAARDELVVFGGATTYYQGTADTWLYIPPP